MTIEEQVLEIRRRIALLEGQISAGSTELSKLKSIPCPACNGSGNLEKEGEGSDNSVYFEQCELCKGSGKAAGATGY